MRATIGRAPCVVIGRAPCVVIGSAPCVATGTRMAMPLLARLASGCQPDQTIVSPRRKVKALPASARLRGSLTAPDGGSGASLIQDIRNLLPRLVTSYSSAPLPRAGSAGRRMNTSVSYSTVPRALRGAWPSSAMPALAGSLGSISPWATASMRTYGPALPKLAPSANGSCDTTVSCVRRAAAGLASSSTAKPSGARVEGRIVPPCRMCFRL